MTKSRFLVVTIAMVSAGLASFCSINGGADAAGGEYSHEQFGDMTVMTSNLKVTTFRNGEEIPLAADADAWESAGDNKRPARAYYDNDPATAESCGILYNWYAVTDPRGLAPEGWHVPSSDEWKKLGAHFAEAYPRDLTPIKSKSGWVKFDNGDNSSGFNAYACGMRGGDGDYSQFGDATGWWSASKDGGGKGSNNSLLFTFSGRFKEYNVVQNVRSGGLSVRCIKD